MKRCNITESHCELCGRLEDRSWEERAARGGYSGCCNERMVEAHRCRGHHVLGQSMKSGS